MDPTAIILLVAVAAVLYFLMIRPGQKQRKKQQEMMDSLGVGSRVMLGSGIYGTIRHLGEKQAIIEISPGVDLTILRAAIRGSVSEDEEEFEYTSEVEIPEIDDSMEAYEADLATGFEAEAAATGDQGNEAFASDDAADVEPTSDETDEADESSAGDEGSRKNDEV